MPYGERKGDISASKSGPVPMYASLKIRYSNARHSQIGELSSYFGKSTREARKSEGFNKDTCKNIEQLGYLGEIL